MQTFRISKVQEQSYYAIRIFGIVHLIAAVGLVVLLDGPGNGLRGLSWFLSLLLLSGSFYLLVRLFQARAGRIHGHYVLTRNTLAILVPGQPRMFVHRKECTGILPESWRLVLRNGRHLSLRSLSSRLYLKDLVSGVCKSWWPGFHGSALWENSFSAFPDCGLKLRIDFRGCLDGFDPLFVYTRENSRPHHYRPILLVCGVFFVYFLALPVPSLYNAIVGDLTPGVLLRLAILSFLCLAGAASTLKFGLHIYRQLREFGTLKDAYVISSRSLAVLRAGDAPTFYRSEALTGFHPYIGQLNFQDGRSLLAAPYLYGDRYDGMLRCLFMRWRPGQENPLIPRGATNPQALLFLPLVPAFQFWTISGSDFPWDRYWTDAVGNASLMLTIFFIAWFFCRKHAANRIDVSLAHGEGKRFSLGDSNAASQ